MGLFTTAPAFLIFDTSNVVARAVSVSPDGYVRLFCQMLLRYRQRFANRDFVFCLEGNGVDRRREIYGGYKAHREATTTFHEAVAAVQQVLACLDCQTVQAPDGEADDAIATFISNRQSWDVLIVSEDRDLWQLLDSHTKVLAKIGRSEVLVDRHVCRRQLGVDPVTVPLYKAVFGDKSDGIPRAVPRVKTADLKRIIQQAKTVDGWAEAVAADQGLTEKTKSSIDKTMDTVERNHRLVRLWRLLNLRVQRHTPDVAALRRLVPGLTKDEAETIVRT